jgi:hypothetical protein
VPTPVVGPTDAFYGITADCTLPVVAAQKDSIAVGVKACLDDANTASCFVKLSSTAAKDTIVCVVQQSDMSLHKSIAQGTADDTMKAEAAAASNWIRTEQIGIRNQ